MDLLDFRTSLETVLVDVLGTYTLGNSTDTPALSVRSEGETVPSGTKVSGLECVIIRDPSLTPVIQYRNPGVQATYTIYLVDWEGSGVLEEAANALLLEWPGAELYDVRVPSGLGAKAQMRVEITNP